MQNILDKNKREIKEGQTIKFGYFYWDEGSSEDWFGTEPQVSWHVVEAYPEERISKVYLNKGALCIKKGKIYKLRDGKIA